MKKLNFLTTLMSFALLSFPFTVSAQLLLEEPFNYTPDAINGLSQQSNGIWQVVGSGDSTLVTSGNLSYPGLPASLGNKILFGGEGSGYYRTFAGQSAGTIYGSFVDVDELRVSASWAATAIIPLPITLGKLMAEAEGCYAKISWTTFLENNNEHFELEHSVDLINFKILAEVAAKGTTNNQTEYSVYDYHPQSGINWRQWFIKSQLAV
jgi:hypothetical protein